MSSWRVEGPDGRYVEWDDKTGLNADGESLAMMLAFAGKPVPLTPTGPAYTPSGEDDPVGRFVLACWTVPGPQTVSGKPPKVPAPDYPDPGDGTNVQY